LRVRCPSISSSGLAAETPAGFDDLPIDEKVRYVETLWNRIATTPEQVAVPDWHRQLLRDRLAEHRKDPCAARPWSEIRDDLLQELAGNERAAR
jgi:putative addiction module component (TIGR02574 family)